MHRISVRKLLSVLILPVLVWGTLGFGLLASAQTTSNQTPHITSEPTLTLSAGQTYQYILQATDSNTDQVSFRLTTLPDGMQLSQNTISWQPTVPGTYNVAVEARDQNNGFDTQAWQITVSPGAVASLVITPNDRPTVVNVGDNRQFAVTGFDALNNEISGLAIAWTTDSAIGSIDPSGLFIASHGGSAFVAAASGEVNSSVGVVVKDIRSELAQADTNTNTAPPTSTDQNTTVNAVNENTNTATDGANTEPDGAIAREEALASTNEDGLSTEQASTETACTNWAQWIIVVILIAYLVILYGYYTFEKKRKSSSWWIFPVLMTVVGLIIYYKYVCPDTYRWWPWILVAGGIVVTMVARGRHDGGPTPDQTPSDKLPF